MSMPPSATTDAPAGPAVARPRPTVVRSRPSRFRLLAGDPKLWLGLGLLSSVLLMAAFAPAVTFHDPLAAVCVLEPDVCTWRGGRVSVELTSRRLRGATSFDGDADGSPHLVAGTVDPARFFDALFGAW